MATIKSFTSLEQSKKLAEILPLESADMYWDYDENTQNLSESMAIPIYEGSWELHHKNWSKDIPCWSLAALLNIIRETIPYKMEYFGDKKVQLTCFLGDKPWELMISDFDNEVDACYEMILKFNELNVL